MAETRFHTLLKQRVADEVSKKTRELAAGIPTNFDTYRQVVGYIKGMEDTLALCDLIEQEFEQ